MCALSKNAWNQTILVLNRLKYVWLTEFFCRIELIIHFEVDLNYEY